MNTALSQGDHAAQLRSAITKKTLHPTSNPSNATPTTKSPSLRGSHLWNEMNNATTSIEDDDYASFSSSNLSRFGGVGGGSRDFLTAHYNAFSTSYDAFFVDDMDAQNDHGSVGLEDNRCYEDQQRYGGRVDNMDDDEFFRSAQIHLQQQHQLQATSVHEIQLQQEDLGAVKGKEEDADDHDEYTEEDTGLEYGSDKKRKAAWREGRVSDTDSDQGGYDNDADQDNDDGDGDDSGEGEELAVEGLKDLEKAEERQDKRRRKSIPSRKQFSRNDASGPGRLSRLQIDFTQQHSSSALSSSSSSSFTSLSPLSPSLSTPTTSSSSLSSSSSSSSSSAAVAAAAHCSSNFITEQQFLLLAEDYLLSLSPKKREKALLSNAMYQKILMVLIQPKNTQVSTAQFRFWAKKMFTLSTTPTHHVVCHGGKPVATKECLYDVLVYCHRKSSHGGRDKTSAEVRQHYSWVPKELIARFVKHCPLCLSRRSTQQRQGTSGVTSSSPGVATLNHVESLEVMQVQHPQETQHQNALHHRHHSPVSQDEVVQPWPWNAHIQSNVTQENHSPNGLDTISDRHQKSARIQPIKQRRGSRNKSVIGSVESHHQDDKEKEDEREQDIEMQADEDEMENEGERHSAGESDHYEEVDAAVHLVQDHYSGVSNPLVEQIENVSSGMVGISQELDISGGQEYVNHLQRLHQQHHHSSYQHQHQHYQYLQQQHRPQSAKPYPFTNNTAYFHNHHSHCRPSTSIVPVPVAVHPNGHILHDRHPIHNRARVMGLAGTAGTGVGAVTAGDPLSLQMVPLQMARIQALQNALLLAPNHLQSNPHCDGSVAAGSYDGEGTGLDEDMEDECSEIESRPRGDTIPPPLSMSMTST